MLLQLKKLQKHKKFNEVSDKTETSLIIMDIDALIKNLQAVDMNEVIQLSVALTVKDLERIQRDQMLEGEDSKGEIIGKYKSKEYAKAKHILNPRPGLGNMDFKLKGDFQKLIYSTLDKSGVILNSTDKKNARLLTINKNVFGLNLVHAQFYSAEFLADKANEIIKKQLNGV